MDRARPLYLDDLRCLLTLFDLRHRDAEQRLHHELAAWRGCARKEILIDGRAVLVMRPGGAAR
jgi:hypothetical protein